MWVEFYRMISKIFFKKKLSDSLLRFTFKTIALIYLVLFCSIVLSVEIKSAGLEIVILYPLLVSIGTDIGGLVFGKVFKGKKLSKVSPNKTVAGSIGSFIFSLTLIPFFLDMMSFYNLQLLDLIFVTLLISLISQVGDLFISLLKRKAKIKDTSNLLPGHGGFLDRLDGVLFSIPFGIFLFRLF
tara:strand:- start:42 stop:593 length:552 start_codon:yes stop_codon:yes gene_type:complete